MLKVIAPVSVALVAFVSVFALAQKGKDAPASVTLSAETVKRLQEKAKDARIARLEAEKLDIELRLGQINLERISEQVKKSQEASDREFVAVCEKAGIPASDVGNYEGSENEKGEFVLKRKATK